MPGLQNFPDQPQNLAGFPDQPGFDLSGFPDQPKVDTSDIDPWEADIPATIPKKIGSGLESAARVGGALVGAAKEFEISGFGGIAGLIGDPGATPEMPFAEPTEGSLKNAAEVIETMTGHSMKILETPGEKKAFEKILWPVEKIQYAKQWWGDKYLELNPDDPTGAALISSAVEGAAFLLPIPLLKKYLGNYTKALKQGRFDKKFLAAKDAKVKEMAAAYKASKKGKPLIEPDKTYIKSEVPKDFKAGEVVDMKDVPAPEIPLRPDQEAALKLRKAGPLESKVGEPLIKPDVGYIKSEIPPEIDVKTVPREIPEISKRAKKISILRETGGKAFPRGPEGILTQKIIGDFRISKSLEPIKPMKMVDIKGRRLENATKKINDFRESKGLPPLKSETTLSFMGMQNMYEGLGKWLQHLPKEHLAIVSKRGLEVMDLIKSRRADIDKGMLMSEGFIRGWEHDLTKIEREAMPLIIQGMKNPQVLNKINRGDLIDTIKNPSKNLLETKQKIGKYLDEAHQFLQDYFDSVGYKKDYITQLWDLPKEARGKGFDNFMKQRKIPSVEQGIKDGFIPRTLDVAEILRVYDRFKVRIAFNKVFGKELLNMVADDGTPLVQTMKKGKKVPQNWKTVENPALGGTAKVHPDIAREVEIVFGKSLFDEGFLKAIETINAFTKKSMLTLSLFHHWALTEAAFSTGIGTKALKLWNPKRIIEEVRKGNHEIFRQMDLAKDSIDHGVAYGALSDIQRGRVENFLRSIEHDTKNTTGLKHITKGMRSANEIWDTALWDYYHNTLKLMGYEENKLQMLKHGERIAQKKHKRSLTAEEITAIKNEAGKLTNDTFGGQNWDMMRILGHPKMRQSLQFILLAPDWTLSTLKQSMAPFRGLYKQAKARKMPTIAERVSGKIVGKTLTKQGTMFWVRAGIYYNVIAQSLNYYNTKKDYGEGRFTWENPEDEKWNIYVGHEGKDKVTGKPIGLEIYLRPGKQFREVMEYLMDFPSKAGAKLSPFMREFIRQVSKYNPGSGYPTPWAEEQKGDIMWKERILSTLEMPIPFSLRPYIEDRPTMFLFTLPKHKGMTNYDARKQFKEAIKNKDLGAVKKIYAHALENNLDGENLFKSAKSSVKADITFDNKRFARELVNEFDQLDMKARQELYLSYKKKGFITSAIKEQLNKIYESRQKVKQQQKKMEIIKRSK